MHSSAIGSLLLTERTHALFRHRQLFAQAAFLAGVALNIESGGGGIMPERLPSVRHREDSGLTVGGL